MAEEIVEYETVDKLEIIHEGGIYDGYPTFVRISDKAAGKVTNVPLVRNITVAAVASGLLAVRVECQEKTIVYTPEEFDLTLGEVRVEKRKDRYPCAVSIAGHEVRTKTISIRFTEGECVTVTLSFLPTVVEPVPSHILGA